MDASRRRGGQTLGHADWMLRRALGLRERIWALRRRDCEGRGRDFNGRDSRFHRSTIQRAAAPIADNTAFAL